MLNYIDFTNPESKASGLPNAHCMIYKPKVSMCSLDYKQEPRINYSHLAKVLEAKKNKLSWS